MPWRCVDVRDEHERNGNYNRKDHKPLALAVSPRAMNATVIVAKFVPLTRRRARNLSDTRHQDPRGFETRMIFGPSGLRSAQTAEDPTSLPPNP
jgi:hypothetical protein